MGVKLGVGGGQEPSIHAEEIVMKTYSLVVLGNLPQT